MGSYVDGLKQGSGAYYWTDETKYYGEWRNNEISGSGYIEWKDGRHYIG